MTKKFCNLCGKEFDKADIYNGFSIFRNIGYGSKYDGQILHLDICCGCVDTIIEQSAINPLTRPDDDPKEEMWF